MTSESMIGGGTPGASATTGASAPAVEPTPPESTARRQTAADKLASLSTVEGWLAILAERVTAAVEAARKADPAFTSPDEAATIEASLGEALALVLPEVAPKLAALAAACEGAHAARVEREAASRVEAKRRKVAEAKASRDPNAASREVESLRARLAALEAALAPAAPKATT